VALDLNAPRHFFYDANSEIDDRNDFSVTHMTLLPTRPKLARRGHRRLALTPIYSFRITTHTSSARPVNRSDAHDG